jgi:hypothetical protein
VRRKWVGADKLPEQLDHFRLAGNFSIQKRTHRGGAEGAEKFLARGYPKRGDLLAPSMS